MTMNKKLAVITIAAVATFASNLSASAAEVAGVFRKGSTGLVITGGTGYAFNETYLVLGLGVSYYVVDGLSLGLAFESWSGADPALYKLTPSVQYVFHQVPVLKPYIGGFYRRTYVGSQPDINSWGGRAGAYLAAGRNAYLGFGAVYESYVDCNRATTCSESYPEVSFTFAF
jgi:hypothetical protein